LWACDISALRQLSAEHLKDKIALFKPVEVIRWQSEPNRGRTNRRFTGTNPAPGAQLWYSLPTKAERVAVRIEDIEGRVVRELRGAADVGLNRASWDFLQTPAQSTNAAGGGQRGSAAGQRGGAAAGGQRGGARGRGGSSPAPPAGQQAEAS